MRQRLKAKGWTDAEIDHAHKLLTKAEKKKHPHIRKVESSVFWFILMAGFLLNLVLSIVMIPLFVADRVGFTYLMTGICGIMLGSMIVVLLKDLHWLTPQHHLFGSMILPIVGVFNYFIVISRVNAFTASLGISSFHNPVMVGVVYFVSFELPYAYFLLRRRT